MALVSMSVQSIKCRTPTVYYYLVEGRDECKLPATLTHYLPKPT
jgi:hypothetical protein